MSHGNQQLRTTLATLKNVVSSSQPSSSVLPSGTSGTPPAIITSSSQEGRVCVFKKVEQVMENFRGGQSTRFQMLTNIVDELDKWTEASDGDREQALKSYMAELNSISANSDRNGLGNSTQPSRLSNSLTTTHKQQHINDDDLEEHLSRAENEQEDKESTPRRKRAREEDMPWYLPSTQSTRREICIKMCKTLQNFSDLPGVKFLVQATYNLPDGIPSSQWESSHRGTECLTYQFHNLGGAILHSNGVEYKRGGIFKPGRGEPKTSGRKDKVCRRFNSLKGC